MTATERGTDWWSRAACRFTDPDLFFPVSSLGLSQDQVARAKSVCSRCEVRGPCLDFALATSQIHGVWGGTSEQERQRMRPRRHACGVPAGQV